MSAPHRGDLVQAMGNKIVHVEAALEPGLKKDVLVIGGNSQTGDFRDQVSAERTWSCCVGATWQKISTTML